MRRLAVTIVSLVSLSVASSAGAHSQRQLSVSRARAAIAGGIGPETTTGRCWRLSRTAVKCGYSTPAVNVGLVTEDPGARFSSWAVARLQHSKVKVSF